ncbi:hypothetical protein QQ045_000483 [Rhodiola kirilowii]
MGDRFLDYHIDVLVKGKNEFYLTLFYGWPRVQDRKESWSLLRRLRKESSKAWLVMGDFNKITFSREMERKRPRQKWQMTNFRCCLDDCDLMDLGYKGERFTYSNRRKDTEEVKAWLDRAVANEAWRHLFPTAMVKHGFANSSDHVPVVIYVKATNRANMHQLKRFEPMWLRHKCFKEVELRTGLRTEEAANQEATLSGELDEWMETEELFWRQRSREEWLKNGDRNTSYFHAQASQRRRRNHIDMLRNQMGEACESEEGLVSLVTNYFTNIFHSQVNSEDSCWGGAFDHTSRLVSDDMNDRLKAPFTEGEVKRALFQMHPTKALGLDGFTALFFQGNWQVVGWDVTREVLEVLNHGRMDAQLNETLIVLIPKVKDVERVEDLRPISLCNVVMKIVTKALANRLKEILPDIISQNQSTFIGGRLITDNILIAHEVSHFIKSVNNQKKGYISMKLDMSKAYDRVEWHFLVRMMEAMGFAQEWTSRIMLCVKTVKYKVKVNGSITEEILPSCGLRQGDPISPYLFLICAEWLTHTINKHQELGLIKGISNCRRAPVITHLMFADDVLICLNAEDDALGWVKRILQR